MVAAVERADAERLTAQIIGHTRATFFAIGGSISDDGNAAMHEWIDSLSGPEGSSGLPYELDPNARPDANFLAMMARTGDDGGGMGVQRVQDGEQLPPEFADSAPVIARLRQLEAEKARAN